MPSSVNIADDYKLSSEYSIGERATRIALTQKSAPHVAVIGLGCGMTLQAVLSNLPTDAKVDVIEINPKMPDFAKYFAYAVPDGIHDPRVTLVIEDAFHYFATRGADAQYDAIIMDVALGESAYNVAHLFSKEMFQNISRHLRPEGVFALWTPETSPFSKVSRMMHSTIASALPIVMTIPSGTIASGLMITHFAAKADLLGFHQLLTEQEKRISTDVNLAAEGSPINTLDSLVINRMPFAALVPDYRRTRDAQIRQ
jgi:spermidine synthase